MNLRTAAIALLFVAAPPSHAEDAPWTAERTDVAIPMRDRMSLAADVHLPEKPGRYPAVVVQTPYNRALMRPALRGAGERGPWDREHYAYVVADWRGFFGSKKAGRAGVGQRGEDGFDVVEWTAAQTWCDGKVGTWGPSALGRVQLETAAEQPPHLVCCVPLVAPIGQWYEDYYEGGVLKEAYVAKLDALGFGVSQLVKREPLRDTGAWKFVMSLDEHAERIDVPMFFITGWYDHATDRELGSFQMLGRAGAKAREGSRLLVGPWTHMAIDKPVQGEMSFPAAAGEAARETRLFFDAHLRGIGVEAWAARPRIRVWRCGEDGWTGGAEWPSRDSWVTLSSPTLTLHADGTMDEKPPAADEPARGYLDDPASPVPTIGGANLPAPHLTDGPSDQTPLLARDDVLVYTTAPLAEPLRLEGESKVTAWLRTDRPDVDLSVRLCEVLPDGRTMLVADSIQRAQLRYAPRRDRLTPGKAEQVTVALPSLAYTWPKGGRLRLILAGSNWPRYERNPHTGELHYDAAKSAPAKVEILHDAAHVAGFWMRLLPPAKPAAPAPK